MLCLLPEHLFCPRHFGIPLPGGTHFGEVRISGVDWVLWNLPKHPIHTVIFYLGRREGNVTQQMVNTRNIFLVDEET